MATRFLLKRYEICFDARQTLNPEYFDPTQWAKAKHVSELRDAMQQLRTFVAAHGKVDNVTFHAFSFDNAADRAAWKSSLEIPHREYGRLGRQAQAANNTVNLFFDLEETVEGEIVANINDIKRSTFNTSLSPYSLGQQKDLLAAALKLQF